ncbi:MAG TPA: MBL fold metallo-hydrolase [Myxococcales bacterium]|nr:MBL fold metallo-hydrolase [Myxococcales bacterium]
MVFEELNGVDSECRSYLVADSGEALIVDPLLEKVDAYLARVSALNLRLAYAADTHTHADHLSGSKELSRRAGAKIAGAPEAVAQIPLHEGSVLIVGQVPVRVWESPGHTADSLVFILPDRVIAGDTLFIGSTGRTDLPSGDPEQEWESLQRLLTLPDQVQVWPGHDYNRRISSTIGEERRTNNRLLLGREKFLAAMREPRPSKPARLAEALAYNSTPAAPGSGTVED